MHIALVTLVVVTLMPFVSGRPTYPMLLPNGLAGEIPGSGITCAHLGHKNCQPPVNNKFGLDFKKAGYRWTKAFCMLDSDNDGLTNGEELGDPCCEWSTANTTLARMKNLSHPGDSSKKAAGNVTCAYFRLPASAKSKPSVSPPAPSKSAAPSASTSSTANTTVSVTPATNTSGVCFPGDAEVALQGGLVVSMATLAVGDMVEVARGVYSPVFMFTHKVDDVHSEFVRIRTRAGAKLQLSAGHFLYVDGRLAPAGQVRVGHFVEVDAKPDAVVAVDRVLKKGLYNPQTVHGDIVVDRVRASTFTQAFHYSGAQAALTPFRAVYGWFGASFQAFESGVRDAFLSHGD